MIVISVECFKKNCVCSQLGVASFSSLPVFYESLGSFQYGNFFDLSVSGFFRVSDIEPEGVLNKWETVTPKVLEKIVLESDSEADAFLFKNNFYFDTTISDVYQNYIKYDYPRMLFKYENDGEIYAAFCKVRDIRRALSVCGDILKCFEINEENVKIEKLSGYVKRLGDVFDYKNFLTDILNNKTSVILPKIAEGVYTTGEMPSGDFVIIPPVYFDTGVQIEMGAVIGPNSIVMKNTLVSANSHIADSVLMDNVYVSSDCYIEDSICCENVSVRRSAAVFSDSFLGVDSVVGENAVVENGSVVRAGVVVELEGKSPFKGGITEYKNGREFQGLFPEKAALLGAALGAVFERKTFCIATDGEVNSQVLKLAVLSGLMSTGADCVDIGVTFNAAIFFSMAFCEYEFGLFISGKGGGTDIKIYEKDGKLLSRSNYFNVICMAKSPEIKRCSATECKPVHQMKGIAKMYIRYICNCFSSSMKYSPDFFSTNKAIMNIVNSAVGKIGVSDNCNDYISFNINEEGTNLTCEYKNETIPHRRLSALVLYNEVKKENNTEYTLDDFGLKPYESAFGIIKNLWREDAVFLAFKILQILNDSDKNILGLIENIPEYYVAQKLVDNHFSSRALRKKLIGMGDKVEFVNGELKVLGKNRIISVKREGKGKGLLLAVKAYSSEVAEEIIAEIERILKED